MKKDASVFNYQKIQAYLKEHTIDWLLVPREDEFLGEYVPAYNERLLWASGFSGSAGVAIIGQKQADIFIDGRYTLQAKQEAEGFEVHSLSSLDGWLRKNLNPSEVIGLNLRFHHQAFIQKLKHIIPKIHHLEPYPIDQLWADRPLVSKSLVVPHDLKYTGESVESKLKRVIHEIEPSAEALYVHDPHDVAWVLNIRGKDLPYTPIALCRALIWKDGGVDLFVNQTEVSPVLKHHLGNNVRLHHFDAIEQYLLKPKKIHIDKTVSAYDHALLAGSVVVQASPISIMKAIKNPIEIDGMRQAHAWDGQALCKFREWLKASDPAELDEITAAEQLELFRKECLAYQCPSFPTISAFESNGAIVHYRASKESNRPFKKNDLYLVDSGGQYQEGTTDVTRTFIIGKATLEQKKAYTLVLKGHLRLARAIFPEGTTGHQLDALARYDLWQSGLNYDHGTGHGVGSYLSVHEGPQGISSRANPIPLQVGMVLSNEPGYYRPGEFGIRIENMMVVQKSEYEGYLCFETLTQVPYEKDLIEDKLLTENERDFLYKNKMI